VVGINFSCITAVGRCLSYSVNETEEGCPYAPLKCKVGAILRHHLFYKDNGPLKPMELLLKSNFQCYAIPKENICCIMKLQN